MRTERRLLAALALAAIALLVTVVAIAWSVLEASPAPSPVPSPTLVASSPGPSGRAAAGRTASPTTDPAAIAAAVAAVEAQVPPLRGLAPLRPVPDRILDEAALQAALKAEYQQSNPPAMVAATQAFYEHLGLLPPDSDLQALTIQLLSSQVIGFYDQRSKTLSIVSRSGSFGPLERLTVAHEFTHALQDQHFGLAGLQLDAPDQGDRDQARLALVEGDATLLMQQWTARELTTSEQVQLLAAASDPSQLQLLARVPDFLVRQLLFPYTSGLAFVQTLYGRGGWSAVDAAYASPPVSTSQILHPDRYLAHDLPLSVTLPADLAAAMGAGWQVRLTDTLGELTTQQWLAVAHGSSGASTVAAGWNGDRVVYLEGPDAWLVVWRSSWRDAAAAQAFAAVAQRSAATLGAARVIGAGDRVDLLLASDAATVDRAAVALGR